MRASSLPLRHRVGQLLIMGLEGPEVSPATGRLLTSMHPGGVILFARNIQSPHQCAQLLRICQTAVNTPLFRCVDLEGGTVDRLRNIIAPAPSAADVFRTDSEKLFEKHGRIIGEEVRALGFNVDFAPVFDLDLPEARHVLTSRTVSDNPKSVIRYAQQFLKGLTSAKVLGCGKHFPGLGGADLDTHRELPAIQRRWDQLWSEDLRPYHELSKAVPFVMVAHATYPRASKQDPKTPASLSRAWITDVLKKKIGYRGLVISDDLEMGGVLAAASMEDAALGTLRAGADIFLVCQKEEFVWRCYEAVLQEAERDRKFADVVTRAADRVLRLKTSNKALKQTMAMEPTSTEIENLKAKMHNFAHEVERESAAGWL
ncbi:MAG: beta-N-acetylhexosaminidase [Acidobacteria bacterium]|nr:MAG: beta-N-acetylhexosaminidase [Acidobacteriota bacterium]